MNVTHKLTMHLDDRHLIPCIDAVQCDANTRVLEVTLLSGGEAWTVPTGMKVSVAFRKSDGTSGWYDVLPDGTKACSVSGNVVTAILAPQVLTAAGKAKVAIVIQDPDTLDQIATFPVTVDVARNPAAGQAVSNDYFNYKTMGDVNDALDGFDQELEEFRECVRPYKWTVNTTLAEMNGWTSFLDLPTNRIYRLSYSLPDTFGHPVPGEPGTLIAFDASGGNAVWGTLYLYAVTTSAVGSQTYFAYVPEDSTVSDVVWKRIDTDMETAGENGEGGGSGTSGTGGASTSDAIPDHVVSESDRVAKEVLSKQNANTFTFLVISDMHQHLSDSQIMGSNTHAGQGMDLVRQAVHIDFGVVLGDNGWGSGIEGDPNRATLDLGIEEIRSANKCIDASLRGIPNFRVPGNHCSLIYNYSFNGNAYLDNDRIFPFYGAYNTDVVWPDGQKDRGYCYRDIEAHKLRVICMNTSDFKDLALSDSTSAIYVSGTQMKWFAETIDLSDKADAGDWSIIILSHCPLDFGISSKCCEIMKAYLEGTSVSLTRDGITISYDYSGKNAATIVGNFYGHNHNYLVDHLRYISGGNGTDGYTTSPIDVLRIGIPNACFRRANERGKNDGADVYDIEYGEETTYEKVAGTAEDTAFCVVTVDRVAKKIYATHYGAGYDREIDYGSGSVAATYTVRNDLSNVTNSNTSTNISEGGSYIANIAAVDGHTLETVTVTMGGVDITTTAYADGAISIASVTGNIVITANAVAETTEEPDEPVVNYTNQIPISTDTDGSVYNGVGYKTDTYLNSSGAAATKSGVVATGFIPIGYGSSNTGMGEQVIYLKGIEASLTDTNVRIVFYLEDKSFAAMVYGTSLKEEQTGSVAVYTLGDDGYVDSVDCTGYTSYLHNTGKDVAYFRICSPGIDAGSIITVNEPIT